jgi:LysR family transcriptional regulator, transcriptional activator of nhaA
MEWLNYHHLYYFWTVAREGGVTKASRKLNLSQPTVSAQIKRLEEVLGVTLFTRQGRSLVLTDAGRVVLPYAEEIFSTGRDLFEMVKRGYQGRATPLTVGVSNAVPKLVVVRLLRPVMTGPDAMRIVCHEASTEHLLAQLATHLLDVVLTDAPAPAHIRVKAFNHVLGESETAFFGSSEQAQRLRRQFPKSLNGVPMAVPTSNSALRMGLDEWFLRIGVRPNILGEFEDPALMKAFGSEAGLVFPAPAAIEQDICRVYNVRTVGRTAEVRERYYAISAERRLTHPGVLAITGAAREDLFV